jgi:hypothetical protein
LVEGSQQLQGNRKLTDIGMAFAEYFATATKHRTMMRCNKQGNSAGR